MATVAAVLLLFLTIIGIGNAVLLRWSLRRSDGMIEEIRALSSAAVEAAHSQEIRTIAAAVIELTREHLKLAEYSHANVHELRNILNNIVNRAETLAELLGKVDNLGERLEMLSMIVRHIDEKNGTKAHNGGAAV